MAEQGEYLKVPEVAGVLRIGLSQAQELVREGEIPPIRLWCSVGGSRR